MSKLTLIYNWAIWCQPCRTLTPIVENLAKSRSDVEVIKRDVDGNDGLYLNLPPIMAVPTFWLLKNGELVWQGGAVSKTVLEQAIKDNQ
jgi:thioredoxin 1